MQKLINSRNTSRDWLDDRLFDEDSPLLTRNDRNLIEDIVSEARNQTNFGSFGGANYDGNINEKICIVQENLKRIVERLRMCKLSKEEFKRKYPEWRKHRINNVQSLIVLGNLMHLERKNCNTSRLVGNCVSLAGGIGCVVSAALIPFSFGLITPLSVACGTMMALGTATSVGTSITELALLKKRVNEATSILEEDKKSLQNLQEWLEHAQDLSEAINAISSIGIQKVVMDRISELVRAANMVKDFVQKNEHVQTIVRLIMVNLKANISTSLPLIVQLIGLLITFVLLWNHNIDLIRHIDKTLSVVAGFATMFGASSNIMQIAEAVIKMDLNISTNVAKAVGRGAIALVGVSLDIASIVLTSIDVHKGSLSKNGEDVIQIACKLIEEADIMESVYDELSD